MLFVLSVTAVSLDYAVWQSVNGGVDCKIRGSLSIAFEGSKWTDSHFLWNSIVATNSNMCS